MPRKFLNELVTCMRLMKLTETAFDVPMLIKERLLVTVHWFRADFERGEASFDA